MGYRGKPIDSDEAALNEVYERIRVINDSLTDRLLPPGFVINSIAGNLVITRADGATSTLVFA